MRRSEILHQTVAALAVIFNAVGGAIGNGWVAPVLSTLQKPDSEFSLTLEQCSWIASLSHIGKIFGAISSSFLLDTVGRKFLLSLCAIIFFIMWFFTLITRSVATIYIIRLIFGVACGISDITSGAYLGEISTPFLRGIFGSLIGTTYILTLVIEYTLATYLSYNTLAMVNLFIGFGIFLSIFGIVEPAQFLLMKGNSDKARTNFLWLKGVDNIEEVANEFEKIQQNTIDELCKKSSYCKLITYPANYKSLLIMVTIYVLVGSTGYYPIMSYCSMMFYSSDILTSNEFTILLGICQFFVAASTSLFISHFNRRSITMVTYSIVTLTHLCAAILYYIETNINSIPQFPWLIFVTLTVFACIDGFAYLSISLIRSELFPLSIKAIGGCLSLIGYAAINFFTTKMFLVIHQVYGIYLNFVIFSVASFFLVLYIYYILPETRNKTLIEIQELLEKNKQKMIIS